MICEPVPNPRAIVSVGLSRTELALIADVARRDGKKLSAFIRDAALQVCRVPRFTVHSISGQGAIHDYPMNRTQGSRFADCLRTVPPGTEDE